MATKLKDKKKPARKDGWSPKEDQGAMRATASPLPDIAPAKPPDETVLTHPLKRINPTAREGYSAEGAGIGAEDRFPTHLHELCGVNIDNAHRILDVGCGTGRMLAACVERGACFVRGVDICNASCKDSIELLSKTVEKYQRRIDWGIHMCDASEEALPYADNTFNIVACTECIEHVANPYRLVAEVKRVLEPNGLFVLSFPMPESNLGYGPGKHAHVYPGFLTRASFERFMMQMYFRAPVRRENGDSAWYGYRNYKGEGVVDVFRMIAGNYAEDELYGVLQ